MKSQPPEGGTPNGSAEASPYHIGKSAIRNPQSAMVLDPFMGSGTTLVACRQLGIPCIGIELEEKSCALAVERLEAEKVKVK